MEGWRESSTGMLDLQWQINLNDAFFFSKFEFGGENDPFILLNQTQLQLSRILAILRARVFLFH